MANSALVCTTSKNVSTATIFYQINLLSNPQGKNHPLVETESLRLAVWKVSGKVRKWKEFEAMLPKLSHIQREKAQQLIPKWPAVSGLAGVMKDKLILS